MGWRRIHINLKANVGKAVILQDHGYAEISTVPVKKENICAYKRYVYRDEYGNHVCIKDSDMDLSEIPEHGPCGTFIGLNATHFYLCELSNIYELRDTVNPSEYNYKEIKISDRRCRDGKSKKKLEEVQTHLKRGWNSVIQTSIFGTGDMVILERKKRLKRK
jgi:hypothetical protein